MRHHVEGIPRLGAELPNHRGTAVTLRLSAQREHGCVREASSDKTTNTAQRDSDGQPPPPQAVLSGGSEEADDAESVSSQGQSSRIEGRETGPEGRLDRGRTAE
jgi:hypothetical protein